jgi:osmotically-inducible protein OsmY
MSEDIILQDAVLAALRYEPGVDAAHVGVAAKHGVVTLSGHVSHFAEKQAAETAAAHVRGVKAVAEEIEVLLPFDARKPDDEIAAAALNRIAWDVALPADAVKIKVEQGWVTMTGTVGSHFQKEIAQDDIRRLRGVVGVSNHIAVKPCANKDGISDAITHALHRSWFFDGSPIRVSVDGGSVRLAGTVRSPHDRQLAAATAWNAPGVTDVENDIEIV